MEQSSNGLDSAQAATTVPQTLQPGNLPQQYNAQYAQASAAAAQQQRLQAEQLKQFWREQMAEIEQVGTDPAEFKNHQLPLARIKKIMKSDEDVRMISAEAPVLFARACEMFILELTLRSWSHSEENKRRTLQRNDIAAAITRTDIFDFLVDIVPREERPDEPRPAQPPTTQAAPGMMPQPFYMPGQLPGSLPGAMPGQMPGLAGQSGPLDPAVYQSYMNQWNNPATAGLPGMMGAPASAPAGDQQPPQQLQPGGVLPGMPQPGQPPAQPPAQPQAPQMQAAQPPQHALGHGAQPVSVPANQPVLQPSVPPQPSGGPPAAATPMAQPPLAAGHPQMQQQGPLPQLQQQQQQQLTTAQPAPPQAQPAPTS